MDIRIKTGRVIRLHSKSQPERAKLYLITDNKTDYYSHGLVTPRTVQVWIDRGLEVTFFDKDEKQKLSIEDI